MNRAAVTLIEVMNKLLAGGLVSRLGQDLVGGDVVPRSVVVGDMLPHRVHHVPQCCVVEHVILIILELLSGPIERTTCEDHPHLSVRCLTDGAVEAFKARLLPIWSGVRHAII